MLEVVLEEVRKERNLLAAELEEIRASLKFAQEEQPEQATKGQAAETGSSPSRDADPATMDTLKAKYKALKSKCIELESSNAAFRLTISESKETAKLSLSQIGQLNSQLDLVLAERDELLEQQQSSDAAMARNAILEERLQSFESAADALRILAATGDTVEKEASGRAAKIEDPGNRTPKPAEKAANTETAQGEPHVTSVKDGSLSKAGFEKLVSVAATAASRGARFEQFAELVDSTLGRKANPYTVRAWLGAKRRLAITDPEIARTMAPMEPPSD